MAINHNEDLNNDHGFVVKPYAKKKLVQMPDGTVRVVYIDIKTGKEVNPKGYQVIQADNTPTPNTSANGTQAQAQAQEKQPSSVAKQYVQANTGEGMTPGGPSASQSHFGDQYGYVNKPALMGLAGLLPGPLGLAGKVANLGVNSSNTSKVNDQREALGMAPNGVGKNVISGLFDQKGYIGELSTPRPGGSPSVAPVSFEGTDKNGRIAYTPEEARRHAILAGSEEATKLETAQAVKDFKASYPQGSFFSKLSEGVKNLGQNIFGGPVTPNGMSTSGYTGVNNSGFPAAPDAPDQNHYSADNSPDDRDQDGPSVDTSHFSPGLW